jgi:hypothetical protein
MKNGAVDRRQRRLFVGREKRIWLRWLCKPATLKGLIVLVRLIVELTRGFRS